MSYILNISTVVPDYKIEPDEMVNFYCGSLPDANFRLSEKLSYLIKKIKIDARYSCIPDFKGIGTELFHDHNYNPSVEERMEIYKSKVVPLASKAISKVLENSQVSVKEITHFITVSCTGIMAPGLELILARSFGLEHTEKSALNFLGCYAALKALKQANYIALADPEACILIVCVELCSLHFSPSETPDDMISNLLFSDGAAAVLVCGKKNQHVQGQVVLSIDKVGSAFIPDTSELMKWDISSSAFKMILSPKVVLEIKEKIFGVIDAFLLKKHPETDFWAIHPGGVKIVEAVQQGLSLSEEQVADSMTVMEKYGNMSSPTILFVLSRIFDGIKKDEIYDEKKIFSCAFGPGLNIEMISLTAQLAGTQNRKNLPLVENEVAALMNGL